MPGIGSDIADPGRHRVGLPGHPAGAAAVAVRGLRGALRPARPDRPAAADLHQPRGPRGAGGRQRRAGRGRLRPRGAGGRARAATTWPPRTTTATSSTSGPWSSWTGSPGPADRRPAHRGRARAGRANLTRVSVTGEARADPPKIISVDDHVVEPPDVWQEWLPREVARARSPGGPREVGAVRALPRAPSTATSMADDGEPGDAWVYDGDVIYVQKAFVAIPLLGHARRHPGELRPHRHADGAHHLRGHATRVLGPRGPHRGLRAQLDGRLPALPHLPPVLRPDVPTRAGTRSSAWPACRPTTTGWCTSGASRRGGSTSPCASCRCGTRGWRPPRSRRMAAKGVHAFCLLGAAHPPGAAIDPLRRLGPDDRRLRTTNDVVLCMHVGLLVDDARGLAGLARGGRRDAGVQQRHGLDGRLVVLGQAHRVPAAEAGLQRGPDRLDPLRPRAGRHRLGAPRLLDAHEGADPGAAVVVLLGPDLRVLHRGPPRRGEPRRGGRGQHLLRDRLPAHRHLVAQLAGLRRSS